MQKQAVLKEKIEKEKYIYQEQQHVQIKDQEDETWMTILQL